MTTPMPGIDRGSLIDAYGRRVTATETRSGLLVILTQAAGDDREGGHPCLDRANAVTLRDALSDFINGTDSEARNT